MASYAVANRGGDMYVQTQALTYSGEIEAEGTADKVETVIEQENYCAFRDSGIVCAFSGSYIDPPAFEALFGADYDDLLAVGSGVIERERHFNNQRGFDRTDDALPYDIPDIDSAVSDYYAVRGWNEDGTVPEGRFDTGVASAGD